MHVVPAYDGTWSGKYHVLDCARVAGSGPEICTNLVVLGGAHYPMRFTITQDNAIVSGTLTLFDNTGLVVVETGQVTGTFDDSGALVLMGETSSPDPSEPSVSTLSGWRSTVSADGQSMVGQFVRNWSFPNFWGQQQYKITCELANVTRIANSQ
jgi:hypothetical protein